MSVESKSREETIGAAALEMLDAHTRVLEKHFSTADGSAFDAGAARAVTSTFAALSIAMMRGHLRDLGATQEQLDDEVRGFVAAFHASLASLDECLSSAQAGEDDITRARWKKRARDARKRKR